MKVMYYINGNNLVSSYEVYVSASKGLIDTPALKERNTGNWPGEHGQVIDYSNITFDARTITLECFVKGDTWETMQSNYNSMMVIFRTAAPVQLLIEVNNAAAPLVAMVCLQNATALNKRFKAGQMIGTFSLVLIEPEPVKMLINPTDEAVTVVLTTANPFTIYWGDGAISYCLPGTAVSTTHTYTLAPKDKQFALITGRVEAFISITLTNATQVWQML